MAIRKILNINKNMNELRRTSRPVEKFDNRLALLLDDLDETLEDAMGAGLAAPQVGVLRRVAIVNVGDDPDGVYYFPGKESVPVGDINEGKVELVNPVLLFAEGSHEWEEGCLSVPGLRGHTVRPDHVRFKAQDRHGNFYEIEAHGFLALALVHETEHLDGKIYIDVVQGDLYREDEADE